jgi:hypothetical protein
MNRVEVIAATPEQPVREGTTLQSYASGAASLAQRCRHLGGSVRGAER